MRRPGSDQGQRGQAGAGWRSRLRLVTATGRHRSRNGLMPELLLLEDRRLLSTFTVTSPADDGSSNTLRWAVAQANAATTASSIEIELGSSAATIALTNGQLELSNTNGCDRDLRWAGARAGHHLRRRRQPGDPDRFPGHGDNLRPHDRKWLGERQRRRGL